MLDRGGAALRDFDEVIDSETRLRELFPPVHRLGGAKVIAMSTRSAAA